MTRKLALSFDWQGGFGRERIKIADGVGADGGRALEQRLTRG